MILKIDKLNKRFGGLHAVNDVSFSVKRGIIKAVIGPNGAGKTTLFNLIAGHVPADSGSTMLNGRSVHGLPPYRIAGLGVSRTFQHTKLFPKMTVLENVMLGRHTKSRSGFVSGMIGALPTTRREESLIKDKAVEVLDFVGVLHLADAEATSLAFGQQRAVELARAIAAEPELLLLDEPAAGLNMHETSELAKLIMRIRDKGMTVLIVEHDMSLVMRISDEIVVLSSGRKIAEDAPLAIQRNKEVISVYLGGEADA